MERGTGMGKEIQEQNIEELLESGSAVQIKPRGYSMYPVIVPGRDEVIVQKADTAKLKRGDVALYRREQSILVIHRIYRKDEKGFFMVGDNQTEIEGPLRPEQIKGKMTVLIKNGREIDVRMLRYRIPCAIWLFMRPVRRPVSLAVAAVKRLLKRRA
ncbi:MAG: S24/S26 family peptidase [Lachnospiraceae bacterium]|nr:S24/S26 family peptidase [Lachnospiraceae bacterium]MCM1240071.1 S24/S26 family peptidase [Lachnospiraceae bacterium]MCM1303815.1 S24/S26 family peptidase [Butyrivibrio sp.]MCM1342857.1 S24/S26 family peptidase [Muribaculaceae bacterium]MCM1410484.1 S24/S26 family peptidase [Lachnospiraceae bacterium]